MEAVLTNGVGCVALVKESFHRNLRKDEEYPIYTIYVLKYYLKMINDDLNLFFSN